MGKSDSFDISFPSELLNLCIQNMPTARAHLVSLSTSLCGRVGPDLTSALRVWAVPRCGHLSGIHRNNRIGITEQIYIVRVVNTPLSKG